MKKLTMSLRWVNGKILLLLFFGMIIAHLIIFVIYSEHNSSVQFTVNREIIARQVVNFIQTIQNTPPREQYELVSAVDIPNFKVSLEKEPKSETRFVQASLWQLLKQISTQSPNIQFSYQLLPERWLNISAEIVRSNWGYQVVLLILEITIVIAVLVFFWIIHRFTVPLKKFASAAERLGVDLDTEPLPIMGPKVARLTAKAINEMQARIKDLVQARTQMLAAISHDLRTLITRLKLRAQMIENAEQYERISCDLDEMETMIAETLAFARDDSKTEKRVNLDLVSLLAAICENYIEMGHDVAYFLPEDKIPVYAGAVSMQRVFSNLIGNALKYAHLARVTAYIDANDVIVEITDNGPGIPDDQLDKVFLPFYRAEHSRSRETGGTGLGLAVAKDITMAHGGRIKIANREPNGLIVTVRLPYTQSHGEESR